MSETFGIVVEIKGGQRAEQEVRGVERALVSTEGAARGLASAAKAAAAETAAAAREAARAARAAAKEQEDGARAAIVAAERRARSRAGAEREASRAEQEAMRAAAAEASRAAAVKAAADKRAAAASAAHTATLRDAYRSIIGPAADYNRKLQEAIALERQGAISAKQRAQYVAGLQREMRQFSAQQQGGFIGGLKGAAASQLGGVVGPAAAIGTATAAASAVVGMSDAYTTLTNRLKAVSETEAEAVRVRSKLLDISNATRIATGATVEVYARMATAGKSLGVSQREVLQFTESLNKAVKLSGATAAEAQAGMIQLAQGLGSGALRGDELRSVLEQLPTVADVIARSMGVTRGELRRLGEEGKISAEAVFKAFREARGELDEKFSRSVATVGELMQVVRNNVEAAVGQLVEQSGIVPVVARAFEEFNGIIGDSVKGLKLMIEYTQETTKSLGALGGALGNESVRAAAFANVFSNFEGVRGLVQGDESLVAVVDAARAALEEKQARLASTNKLLFDEYAKSKEGDETLRYLRRGYAEVLGLERTIKGLGNGQGVFQEDRIERTKGQAKSFMETIAAASEEAGGVIERMRLRLTGVTDAADEFGATLAEIGAEMDAVANANAAAEVERVNDQLARQAQIYQEINGPAIEYQATINALNAEYERGALTIGQYAIMSERARIEAFGGSTAMAQMAAEVAAAAESVNMLSDALASQLGAALNQSIEALVAWAGGAQVSIGDMVRSMLADLAVLMLKLLAFQALKATIGVDGGAGGLIAGALGLAGSRAGGGTYVAPNTGGGTDSVPVYARVSPGERVTFTPPGHQPANDQARSGPISIAPIIVSDQRAAVAAYLRTPAGTQAVITIASENPSAFRAALGMR